MILFAVISSMIGKIFLTYTINSENEITIVYDFISKKTKTFRIDQITSFQMSQSLVQKWTGLADISFGIFGESGYFRNNNSNNHAANYAVRRRFTSIDNYDEIFDRFFKITKINKDSQVILNEKPSTKPAKFFTKLFGFLIVLFTFIIPFLIILISYIITNKFELEVLIVTFLMGAGISIFFLIFLILYLLDIYLYKSSNYLIKGDYLEKNHDYYFSTLKYIVPYKKITNTTTNKNLIGYKFFKVGQLQVYTGGSLDPLFDNMLNFDNFSDILSEKYKNIQKSEYNLSEKQKFENSTISTKNPLFSTKPSASYFWTFFYWMSIFCFPIIIVSKILTKIDIDFQMFIFFYYIGLFIYLLSIITRFLIYKNTKYDFYEDKIVDTSGIINIKTKVTYFRNIKYISLSRPYFFDRILNQGTIDINTAGTSFTDNSINSVKEYKEIYSELKEILE